MSAVTTLRPLLHRGAAAAMRPRRRLAATTNAVALTFDDGPDPLYTPAVLDALGEREAVATFFLVGSSARAHPELVRRMVDEGHAVGFHSDAHPDPWTLRWRALRTDYRQAAAAVATAAGVPVQLFRPPQGHVGAHEAIAMLTLRLRPWLWSIDTFDWQPESDPASILRSLAGVSAGDVVLLHDAIQRPPSPVVADRSATVEALPAVIDHVRAHGLGLARLDVG